MSRKSRILVVEDEETIAVGLEYALEKEGYLVEVVRDGESASRRLDAGSPDLVLLDVMLPKRSGFDVLKTLRGSGRDVPVILLTARGQETDKVRGLDLGADDYVTKPFSLSELLARVRARLRAHPGTGAAVPDSFRIGPVEVDLRALRALRDGTSIDLSTREVDMLRLLWCERGRAVSRDRFLHEVWGYERAPTTRTIDQHVARLRQKIEVDPASPRHLLTVFGVGYRLEVD